ncbi:O-methyltransferase family 3 [Pseudobacteroides cellulosolvens ATCC 35603 = DSM 2933]|uniref:tRNA 5-hydroxyuridine methyltransferase n=2 Tax=Pseudobacteroides cellulosolvens TaxID=35825 RepID=A0A0L6JHC6_9FIRM|nr:O-methyltransferase family 3 [Pseudobacteroides cellulosolvens ATCC 35603 = DSM 2933]
MCLTIFIELKPETYVIMIIYDYINDYIRNTIKENDIILKELEMFAKENHVPIIQPEVAKLLLVTGKLLKPKRILEVGTAIGYSAIILSKVLDKGGKIDTVDRYELMIDRARVNIKRAGLEDTVNIIVGDAVDVLKCLDKKYDMIFLDAAKGQYPEFLPECMRMLNKGGLLFSDNVLYKGMVANDDLVVRRKKTIVKRLRDFLSTICESEELDTSILPVGDGVALSYKK